MPNVRSYEALLSGTSWSGNGSRGAPAFITYSFETRAQSYLDGAFRNSFKAFNDAEKGAAYRALGMWGAASGITFLEVAPGKGDIQFGSYDFSTVQELAGYAGFAAYPQVAFSRQGADVVDAGGDVFIDTGTRNYSADHRLHLMAHEIGHAIGLKHPFDDDVTLPDELDNGAYTIMSYKDYLPSLGTMDLAAIRHLYGGAGSDGAKLAHWSWNAATDTLTQIGRITADKIKGVSTSDHIDARGGRDLVFGAEGNDRLDVGGGGDVVFGGTGNDWLFGSGGNDVLDGGRGADRFVFDTRPAVSNLDRIADFGAPDTVALDRSIFTGLLLGPLKSAAFRIDAEAQDGNDRIIYDDVTGALYFDRDGAGGRNQVKFAMLDAGLDLRHDDFLVVA